MDKLSSGTARMPWTVVEYETVRVLWQTQTVFEPERLTDVDSPNWLADRSGRFERLTLATRRDWINWQHDPEK